MKTFKIIDTWISIILITSFAINTIINFNNSVFIGYFVVGAWQVISMITHAASGWFTEKDSKRYWYHWMVAIAVMAVLLGFIMYPLLFFMLYLLLFVSPFMAVFYTWLCFNEVRKMNQRPLELLK